MRRNLIWASLTALSLLMVTDANADVVFFDFRNGGVVGAAEAGALDPGAVGDTATVDGLGLTIVDVTALEYIAGPAGGPAFVESGSILSSFDGAGVVTNISGQEALGIQNPSISNGNFDLIGGGTESSDINPGETFTFTFDQDVFFTEIELESVVATDELEVLVDDVSIATFVGDDAFIDDLGALGALTITAGQEITFAADGVVATSSFRIESFTVETVAVPEPSSLALLGLFGSMAMIRRRR